MRLAWLGIAVLVGAALLAYVSMQGAPERTNLQAAVFPSTVLLRPGDTVDDRGLLEQQSGTDDGIPAAADIQLVAALGEVESAQVLVTGPAEETLDVRVDTPRMDDIALKRDAVRVHRALVTNVPKASDMDLDGDTGEFWDALLPARDALVGERRNAFPVSMGDVGGSVLIWVDVAVDAATLPGRYEGRLRIVGSADGDIGIPLVVDVVDALIPAQPTLRTAWDINANVPCEVHGCEPDDAAQLHNRYVRMLGLHRIASARTVHETPDTPASEQDLATLVAPLQAAGIGSAGPDALARRYPTDGAVLTDSIVYGWCADCMDSFRSAFERAGLGLDIAFHCDEMGRDPALWNECARQWEVADRSWRSAGGAGRANLLAEPGSGQMGFQVTADIDDLAWAADRGSAIEQMTDAVTRLVPLVNHVAAAAADGEAPARRYADFRARGAEVWVYVSCESHGCGDSPAQAHRDRAGWPQYVVDSHPSQLMAMPVLAFQWGMDGEYHYDTVRDLATAFSGAYVDGGALDGTLLYPGLPDGGGQAIPAIGGTTDIPLGSIRLARIRDGHELFELLALGAQRDPAAARRLAATIYPSAQETIMDSSALAAARSAALQLAGVQTPLF